MDSTLESTEPMQMKCKETEAQEANAVKISPFQVRSSSFCFSTPFQHPSVISSDFQASREVTDSNRPSRNLFFKETSTVLSDFGTDGGSASSICTAVDSAANEFKPSRTQLGISSNVNITNHNRVNDTTDLSRIFTFNENGGIMHLSSPPLACIDRMLNNFRYDPDRPHYSGYVSTSEKNCLTSQTSITGGACGDPSSLSYQNIDKLNLCKAKNGSSKEPMQACDHVTSVENSLRVNDFVVASTSDCTQSSVCSPLPALSASQGASTPTFHVKRPAKSQGPICRKRRHSRRVNIPPGKASTPKIITSFMDELKSDETMCLAELFLKCESPLPPPSTSHQVQRPAKLQSFLSRIPRLKRNRHYPVEFKRISPGQASSQERDWRSKGACVSSRPGKTIHPQGSQSVLSAPSTSQGTGILSRRSKGACVSSRPGKTAHQQGSRSLLSAPSTSQGAGKPTIPAKRWAKPQNPVHKKRRSSIRVALKGKSEIPVQRKYANSGRMSTRQNRASAPEASNGAGKSTSQAKRSAKLHYPVGVGSIQ
ncbi:uncharacterized protein [Bemisia tabaci]|uniref:uncharacterized protein isoform X1 n=1 Tax=Bemisia tabaci TaxID=7038 RepID=UPI003B27C799